MFTPPASPLPSPRAKLEQVNPMEEMQRQAPAVLTPYSSNLPRSCSPQYPQISISRSSSPSPGHSLSLLLSKGPSPEYPSTTDTSSSFLEPLKSSASISSIPSTVSVLPLSLLSPFAVPSPSSPSQQLESQTSEAKRRIGRHIKWTAIAIPVMLILVTLGNYYLAELSEMVRWVSNQKYEVQEPVSRPIHDTPSMVISALHSPHLHHHHDVFQPVDRHVHDETINEGVLRRQESTDISVSVATGTATATELATPTTTVAASASGSATATTSIPVTAQTLPTIPASAPVLPTPFPQPWDSSIAQNFSTQSCYNFFLNMTNSEDFRSCRPFGLLQNTSDDFADFQTNLTALNAIIWGTCNLNPGVDQCTSNMATFASSLQSACAQDLTDNNLFSVSTLQALHAYSLTQNAGCLNDPSTNSYCFVKAAHNTNPSDLYFYSLASGVGISNSTTLTCSACTQSLMSLYVNALNANASQLTELASVYGSAQALAASSCGSTFAQVSTNPEADKSNDASNLGSMSLKILGTSLASLVFAFLFLL